MALPAAAIHQTAIRHLTFHLCASVVEDSRVTKLITLIQVNPAKSGQKVFEPRRLAAPKWNEDGPRHTNDYTNQT